MPSLLCAAVSEPISLGKRPNILFILADDQRYSTIHALGYEEVITPNLDKLVQQGMAFTRAYIMGSTSGAVCVPSRAMLLTGHTLFHLNSTLFNLNNYIGDNVTFPQWFREHGYTTSATGKWHNEQTAFVRSFSRGTTIFLGGMGSIHKSEQNGQEFVFVEPIMAYDGKQLVSSQVVEKDATVLFADEAINFLSNYKDDKPFLMYVPFTAPHDPWVAPKRFLDLYDPAKISLPLNFMPQHPFDNGELKIRDEMLVPFPRTPEVIRQQIARYYACVSWLDYQIGRILEALQKTGQADNTIIIFSGDNGLAIGQHGLMGKQNVYDHSVHVPLIMSGPGVPKDRRTDAFCYLIDLFPTLCDLAGLPTPPSVEGVSLAPVLKREKAGVRDKLFFAYLDLQRAILNSQYKLIEYFVGQERHTQLFNVVTDPWEVKNIADDPSYSEVLQQLRVYLKEWQRQLNDPLIQGN